MADIYKIYYLWKEIFGKKKYILSALMLSILFYILNASFTQWSLIHYVSSVFDVLKVYTYGFYEVVSLHSFISTIILSLLTGVLLTLLTYRVNLTKSISHKHIGFFAYIGIFLGIIVPGCPTCGIGLIAIFGLGASVAALPFKGVELSVLAVIILLIAIYQVSNKILSCDRVRK